MRVNIGKVLERLTRNFAFYLMAAIGSLPAMELVEAQSVQIDTGIPDLSVAKLQAEKGLLIYREGLSVSGGPLRATGAAQTQLSGKAIACAACHRRSGYGTSEGQFNIRPITGPALFEEQTLSVRSHVSRRNSEPVYDRHIPMHFWLASCGPALTHPENRWTL